MPGENQMEKMIIENVIQELAKRGVAANPESIQAAAQAVSTGNAPQGNTVVSNGAPLELADMTKHWVPNPANEAALNNIKKLTPARIGLWRAGARQKTDSLLNFLADHAAAMDAVFLDVDEAMLEKMDLFTVQTECENKDEFLKRPDLGAKVNAEGIKTIQEKCQKNIQVQIVVVDGLSTSSIEANVPDLLPALTQGLKADGISVGTPFYCRFGRVRVQDQIAQLVNADVIISLIGERPGLVTADSMSAYMVYRPTAKTVEADRTLISNIHAGGTPPAEAGAALVDVIKKILDKKASGMSIVE